MARAPHRPISRATGARFLGRSSGREQAVIMFSRTFDWDDTGWRDQASCRDSDPDLFFPVGSTGAAVEEVRAAKAVCGTCPVREQCLAFALETNQEAGIWGGASEEERRALRRQMLASRRAALVSR